MRITKSDFTRYLHCPESFYIAKKASKALPVAGNNSLFTEKLTREGYEVEEYLQGFLQALGKQDLEFQVEFETSEGLFARADAVERQSNGEINLYEVKSSTRVKTDLAGNHIKDVCFQKICAERAGHKINRAFIVHLDGAYVRDGAIDAKRLLKLVDVTQDVANIASETEVQINSAMDYLSEEIAINGCSCVEKSRAQHCDTFDLLNPNMPDHSIYSLPNLRTSKIKDLVSRDIFDMGDIPSNFPLSPAQRITVKAAKTRQPQIAVDAIRHCLSQLKFPLFFFDYETYGSAVPLINGTSPHRQFPVQYSLHILHKDGELEHLEYLQREAKLPIDLVERMQKDIGSSGNLISWHASFEKTRNSELALMYPEKSDFLLNLNERMFDLEDVFKLDYVDIRFDGSTSIKKVLPVICPDLAYSDLEVQSGSAAMDAWQRMIWADSDEGDRIAASLLEYCERDTFAMVEIYRFLAQI